MVKRIALVYAYYDNPDMFKYQQHIWMSYPREVRNNIEIIVTDDCSVKEPAKNHVIMKKGSVPFRLFEIKKKVKWNWLECRNIGAKKAKAPWLILTDMDHVVSEHVMLSLLKQYRKLREQTVYQFERVKAPDMSYYKHHNDSYLVAQKLFWKAGGYDEDFAGLYGTSGKFRRRLYRHSSGQEKFRHLSLILYGREVIPDASTTEFARKEGRKKGELKEVERWKSKNNRGIKHFLQPYEEVAL